MKILDVEVNQSLLELTRHCFYVNEKVSGLKACEQLLSRDIEKDEKHIVLYRRTFYIPKLSEICNAKTYSLNYQIQEPGFSLSHPSIINKTSGYYISFRSSNVWYDNEYRLRYKKSGSSTFISRTVLIQTDLHFNLMKTHDVKIDPYDKCASIHKGLEDLRLFTDGDRILATCSVLDESSCNGKAHVALCEFVGSKLNLLEVIPHRFEGHEEKNWVPVIGKPMVWVYRANESGFTSLARHDGKISYHQTFAAPSIAKLFRGGSQLVPFKDGYLAVVHESAHVSGRSCYNHRFVLYDSNLKLIKWSDPFYLHGEIVNGWNVEFCVGLTIRDGHIIIPFSICDRESRLTVMKETEVDRLLCHSQLTR